VYDETDRKVLNPGDRVKIGNRISTGQYEAEIWIAIDGAQTHVVMKKNSCIKVVNRIKKNKQNGIFLVFGRLWSLFNRKKSKTEYAVETHNSVAGVEGTEFETAFDQVTGKTTITVWEGVVSLKCKNNDAPPIMVNAGMQATMDNDCNHTLSALGPDNNTPATAGWDINVEPDVIDEQPDSNIVRIAPNSDSHVYAYAYRNWNKANWGKYENLGAGWNPTGGERITFLKFDLAGINPNSVDKATLKLYHCYTGVGNAIDIGVYRIMSPWQEGSGTYHSGQTEKTASDGEISWVNQPKIDQYPVVYFNPGPGINKWVEVDVTSLVKAWLTGIPNHGMAIKTVENDLEKFESQYSFRSREFEEADKRPSLIINGGSGGAAQGTARLFTASSNRDMVGPNENFCGDGKTDAIFRAQFSAPNRTVTAVEVSNTNGLRSVWDTRPNNRLWLGGVVIQDRTMSQSDGSVNFSLGSGQNTLDFFVEDNGSIRGGKTNYRMTIFFADGDPLVMNIISGGSVTR
jgi:hypothetical protein